VKIRCLWRILTKTNDHEGHKGKVKSRSIEIGSTVVLTPTGIQLVNIAPTFSRSCSHTDSSVSDPVSHQTSREWLYLRLANSLDIHRLHTADYVVAGTQQ
jgi:hypothetical protein